MSNLQGVVAYDNPLDQELQDALLLLEARIREAGLDAVAEAPEIIEHVLRVSGVPLSLAFLLVVMPQRLSTLLKRLAPFSQLVQVDHLGLVGVDQPSFLPVQPLQLPLEPLERLPL